jgi:uncharacterized protein (DUF885 family)
LRIILPPGHLLLLALLLTACGGGGGSSPTTQVEPPAGTAPPPDESGIEVQLATLDGLAFSEFTEASFEMLLRRWPEDAAAAGLSDVPPTLNDLSPEYQDETTAMYQGILDRLGGYTTETSEQATIFGIYELWLNNGIEAAGFRDYTYPASYFLTSVPSQTLFFFSDIQPLKSAGDASEYTARLRFVDDKINHLVNAVQQAEANGIIMPRVILDASINRHQQATVASRNNPYYTRLANEAPSLPMSLDERDNLLETARDIIDQEIIPAYNRLVSILQGQQAIAPSAVGIGQFTGGQDYYNFTLRFHTTTPLTADEIHALGLQELDRIHTEMRAIFSTLGYPAGDSITANLGRTSRDSGSVPASQVVAAYEAILAEADGRLGEAFNVLPESELIVVGGQAGGFYVRPSRDGSRPGAFHASNTFAEPAYLMKSLAYHEGVPGHHLQIALAQEQGESLVQQSVNFTGFVEGWALYAERLAFELGWYESDPHGNLGRLQYEAFRAARLVVDTGIHARGWSFNEAANFFQANTGFSNNTAQNQISRYAIWPGQATAYMVGMLEFLRVRDAELTQPDFDLKAFHDRILTRGAVPLNMLGNE